MLKCRAFSIISYMWAIYLFSFFCAVCLGLLSTPEGDWCCSNCKDKSVSCRKISSGDSNAARPIMIRLTRVVKEPEVDIGGCCVCRLVNCYNLLLSILCMAGAIVSFSIPLSFAIKQLLGFELDLYVNFFFFF